MRNNISCLPSELLLHIFSRLDDSSVLLVMRVCKDWSEILVSSDSFWKERCIQWVSKRSFSFPSHFDVESIEFSNQQKRVWEFHKTMTPFLSQKAKLNWKTIFWRLIREEKFFRRIKGNISFQGRFTPKRLAAMQVNTIDCGHVVFAGSPNAGVRTFRNVFAYGSCYADHDDTQLSTILFTMGGKHFEFSATHWTYLSTSNEAELSHLRSYSLKNINILLFDITKKHSFKAIQKDLKDHYQIGLHFVLVGNKVDLSESRKITTEKAQKLASSYGIPYIEAAGLWQINVLETVALAVQHYESLF